MTDENNNKLAKALGKQIYTYSRWGLDTLPSTATKSLSNNSGNGNDDDYHHHHYTTTMQDDDNNAPNEKSVMEEACMAASNALMFLGKSAKSWYWATNAHMCSSSGRPRGYTLWMSARTAPVPIGLIEQTKLFSGISGLFLPLHCTWRPDLRSPEREKLTSASVFVHQQRVRNAFTKAIPRLSPNNPMRASIRKTYNRNDDDDDDDRTASSPLPSLGNKDDGGSRREGKEEEEEQGKREEEEVPDDIMKSVQEQTREFLKQQRAAQHNQTHEGRWLHELGGESTGAFAGIYSIRAYEAGRNEWMERMVLASASQLAVGQECYEILQVQHHLGKRDGLTAQERAQHSLATTVQTPAVQWARNACVRARERSLQALWDTLEIDSTPNSSSLTSYMHDLRVSSVLDELPDMGQRQRMESHFSQLNHNLSVEAIHNSVVIYSATTTPLLTTGPPVRCETPTGGLLFRVALPDDNNNKSTTTTQSASFAVGDGIININPLMPIMQHENNKKNISCAAPVLATGLGRHASLTPRTLRNHHHNNNNVTLSSLKEAMPGNMFVFRATGDGGDDAVIAEPSKREIAYLRAKIATGQRTYYAHTEQVKRGEDALGFRYRPVRAQPVSVLIA